MGEGRGGRKRVPLNRPTWSPTGKHAHTTSETASTYVLCIGEVKPRCYFDRQHHIELRLVVCNNVQRGSHPRPRRGGLITYWEIKREETMDVRVGVRVRVRVESDGPWWHC